MATVTRYRVLLLDPVKLRRDRAEEALRLRFDFDSCGTLEEAIAAGAANPPHAVVATLRQVSENGLAACKALRAKLGPGVFIVVHGAADSRKSAGDRQRVADYHGVDVWSESALEPDALSSVVLGELVRRSRPAAEARKSLVQRLRALRWADVQAFLDKDRPLFRTPPRDPDDPPGWIELLNAPPTVENLKRLLRKEIWSSRSKDRNIKMAG